MCNSAGVAGGAGDSPVRAGASRSSCNSSAAPTQTSGALLAPPVGGVHFAYWLQSGAIVPFRSLVVRDCTKSVTRKAGVMVTRTR